MKNKITAFVVFALFVTTSAFAGNIKNNENDKVLTSFNQKFAEAKEVSTSVTNKFVQVRFKMNEQVMFAFFTESGELLGVSRHIITNQLPLALQTEIKVSFPGTWVTELFEYSSENESTYYLTLENADQKILLKSEYGSSWSVTKKVKKS